jgi:hypothetical protein
MDGYVEMSLTGINGKGREKRMEGGEKRCKEMSR